MNERRKNRRAILNIPVSCTMVNVDRPPFESHIVNCNLDGICILADSEIAEGCDLELSMVISNDERIRIVTRVVWCSYVPDLDAYRVGVKLNDSTTEAAKKFMVYYGQLTLQYQHKNKSVLIIDDEEDLVSLLSIEMKQFNCEIITAYDGIDGYEKYIQHQPTVIILDLMLPRLNGYEVCRYIRRKHGDNDTPIIMLTARDEESDRIIGKVLGAQHYITKPFERSELMGIIEKYL